jgi:ribonuclease VapC
VTSVVLDASAMIAFLRGEPGADKVGKRFPGALISAMNYSEVLKKTIEVGGSADMVRVHMSALPISIVPFDVEQAVSTAALYPVVKALGLSFADRACLNLAIRHGAVVLTTDQRMAETAAPVKVSLIRGKH